MKDDVSTTDFCGWLKKEGGRFKSWKRRFFVLSGRIVSYYTGSDKLRKLGEFCISDTSVTIQNSDIEVSGEDKEYIFTISPTNGNTCVTPNHIQFTFSAATATERRGWIRALRKALHLKDGGALFGTPLSEVYRYVSPANNFVPRVVHDAAEFIRTYGMQTEGIFRKCGTQHKIQELADAYDCATPGRILDPEECDVHTVAGLLKLYLRELPEPVIPYEYYDRLKAAGFLIADGQDLMSIVELLKTLPQANYNLLHYLCEFLNEVSQQSSANLMTIDNLASVFAPNMLRYDEEDPDIEMSASSLINLTISGFVQCYHRLFLPDYLPSRQSGASMSSLKAHLDYFPRSKPPSPSTQSEPRWMPFGDENSNTATTPEIPHSPPRGLGMKTLPSRVWPWNSRFRSNLPSPPSNSAQLAAKMNGEPKIVKRTVSAVSSANRSFGSVRSQSIRKTSDAYTPVLSNVSTVGCVNYVDLPLRIRDRPPIPISWLTQPHNEDMDPSQVVISIAEAAQAEKKGSLVSSLQTTSNNTSCSSIRTSSPPQWNSQLNETVSTIKNQSSPSDELEKVSTLSKDEQIRYWYLSTSAARADARGQRAKAHLLAAELEQIKVDLSMVEQELAMLRQRFSTTGLDTNNTSISGNWSFIGPASGSESGWLVGHPTS